MTIFVALMFSLLILVLLCSMIFFIIKKNAPTDKEDFPDSDDRNELFCHEDFDEDDPFRRHHH